MAKRFNVSIPDALAERMEPFKDKLSLSTLMQASIERELARLTTSDEDKERRINFRAAALSAWMKRYPWLEKAVNQFIDKLISQAANDNLTDIFDYYRALHLGLNERELTTQAKALGANEESLDGLREAFSDINQKALEFGESLVSFLKEERSKGNVILDDDLYCGSGDEGHGEWYLREDVYDLMCDPVDLISESRLAHWYLAILENRVRDIMSKDDIKKYIIDFDPEAILWEAQK